MNKQLDTSSTLGKLVDASGLLEALFSEGGRPSMRWLRTQQKNRAVPFIRAGRLVFFDVEKVRAALERKAINPKA